ncbi:K(+)-transporting ATPase subunit C [Pseudopedobacter beijingensis]|uniref:Potassium-transporting ATPase KdpC subunit n=1 Tax=Pseudopedobacter beijingensis TaxID=1207056 RepID=A0ABW4ID02_9SPHI
MKKHIIPAVKLTLLSILLLAVLYPMLVWGIAQISDGSGKGQTIEDKEKKYYLNVGQSFTQDKYFWSRPSAVDYNASGSGGSNKGPSNKEYLNEVQSRIDTFMLHNPGIKKSEIPVDMITASASGLDPDFSVQAARVQVKRIAKIRNLNEASLEKLINDNVEKPFLGIFGPEKINVLKLNMALDQLSNNSYSIR